MRSTLIGLTMLLVVPALGMSTSNWSQTSEADFHDGVFDNVVATNLGDLKLSRAVKTLLEQDPRISAVNALAEGPDGTIYAGTGPQGVLLQIRGEKVETIETFGDGVSIFALASGRDGDLLIGTGGDKGRVFRRAAKGKAEKIFEAEGVQYIWAIQETPDGRIYAATGPQGQLFEIQPDKTSKVLLDTDENNLLSLISDGKDFLYAGSDPNGLVFRINRKSGESFILYDAAEAEVSALALDRHGNLYAGTAEAREEPPAPGGAAAEQIGRPEGATSGVPIPSEPPKEPQPPELPDPNPSRPDPIPKSSNEPDEGAQNLPADNVAHTTRLTWLAADIEASDGDDSGSDDDDNPKEPPGHPAQPGNPSQNQTSQPSVAPGRQPAIDVRAQGEPRAEGNAVYRIDRDGFVSEIFRQQVLVLAMAENAGSLLIATGSEGNIYQVNPATEETIVLAKVEPKQVMALLPARDGHMYMGMANVGGIAEMSSGFAKTGTYSSVVLDATQVSRFGKLQLHGSLPADTGLSVATRSGNVKEAADKSWSKWSDEAPAAEFIQITSPAARFLQYRLTFTSKSGEKSPIVEDVNVAYQVPNLTPQVRTIRIAAVTENPPGPAVDANAPATSAPPSTKQTIAWEAIDPNNDTLSYSLYFRRGTEAPWILLKDKITETQYEWDVRSVADGRYEVKVVASDAAANPLGAGRSSGRVSDPIVIDNTAPRIGDVKWKRDGAGIRVDLKLADRSSVVSALQYNVDSSQDWQAVLPSDNIFDSQEESASFLVPDLRSGEHQVTLRATDAKGNQAFEVLLVKAQGPVAAK